MKDLNITKEVIENFIGRKIKGFSLEPLFINGYCIGLSIKVAPIYTADFVDMSFKILKSGESYEV